MDREDQLTTLLTVVEPAEKAAADATTFFQYMTNPGFMDEIRVRGRLLSIEHEQGITQTEMQSIWDLLDLEYGMPQI